MEDSYILEMTGICKCFPGVQALKEVDFKVKRGEVHCLIGANGAGKSTLMKVLSGAHTQESGQIVFNGQQLRTNNTIDRRNAGISVIYQELSLLNDLSVAENIFINNYPKKNGHIDWKSVYDISDKLAKELNLNIDVKSKVSKLSIGQRQLVELMKALKCNSSLIIMDEPSATLSQSEFQTLLKVINNLTIKGITIIYISHRLEELFIVGNRITIMRDGETVDTLLTSEIDIDKLVECMIGYNIQKSIGNEVARAVSDEAVLRLDNISNGKLQNISFELNKGEILGLYGLVGSGRTETLRVIYGADQYSSGTMTYMGNQVKFKSPVESIAKGIGLMPENRKTEGLVLGLPIWENMTMVSLDKFLHNKVINYTGLFNECNEFKKNLSLKAPSIKTIVQNLSGGNQQKVVLAKWIMCDCELLLIDEPTQGIDVGTKNEIYKIIRRISENDKSIIIASSELEELMQVCDRIAVMYEGNIVKIFKNEMLSQEEVLQTAVAGR